MTVKDKIVKSSKEHNRISDGAEIAAKDTVSKIRQLGKSTQDAPHSVVSSVHDDCDQAVASKLPNMQSIKRTIRSIRQETLTGPALPSTCIEIVFPTELTKSFKGDQFLLYDSGPVEKRIVIFAIRRNLKCLSLCSHWYAGGSSILSMFRFAFRRRRQCDGSTSVFYR
ncbi:Hypothetical predicted protein [Octopus vulgaris]|uniref:Uncharacterized protein n=1 Tax=Octopus vulgaris TaxID=6645 RepID=A0AA36B4Z1_OCTVU|nr:Hypothetical predicted protein [Octopus vulgaris]